MKFREPPTSICLNDDYVILRSENASFTASGACESPLNFEMSSRRFFGCLLFGRANLVFSEFLQTRKRKFLENQTNLNQQTAKKEKDEKKKNIFFRDDASKKSENGKSLENLKIENTRLLR